MSQLPSRFDSVNYSSEDCQDVSHTWKAALLTIDPENPQERFEAFKYYSFSYLINRKFEQK